MKPSDRPPQEQEAVLTTIVGGRPPGAGAPVGGMPRGVEVLLKKAAVDEAFRAVLLDQRDAAAREIGLELAAAEQAMLRAAPRAQLEAIVAATRVAPAQRSLFMGPAAAVMLVALGSGGLAGCKAHPYEAMPAGIDPALDNGEREPVVDLREQDAGVTETGPAAPNANPASPTDPSTDPTSPTDPSSNATTDGDGGSPDSPTTPPPPAGVRPDKPSPAQNPSPPVEAPSTPPPKDPGVTRGIRPDRPEW